MGKKSENGLVLFVISNTFGVSSVAICRRCVYKILVAFAQRCVYNKSVAFFTGCVYNIGVDNLIDNLALVLFSYSKEQRNEMMKMAYRPKDKHRR